MADEFIMQLRVTGPDEFSQTLLLPVGMITIGRQAGNSLVLESQLISRKHAQIETTAGGSQVTDLGSANGTLVNGERLAPNVPMALAHGAVIEVGPFRLAYEQIRVAPAKVVEQPVVVAERPVAPQPQEIPVAPPPESMAPSTRQLTVPPADQEKPPPNYAEIPPGLTLESQRLLNYLPGIYHNDFMARFLGMFEAIITPIEWNVDNFDLYLNPGTAPEAFMPWLENWFALDLDPSWDLEKRRALLKEAHEIYARRGTRWALSRVLEIYTGTQPEIIDTAEGLAPFTFTVRLPLAEGEVDRVLIERIIDSNKPAHTDYTLEFTAAQPAKGKRK
jgi:phage tail-like protein